MKENKENGRFGMTRVAEEDLPEFIKRGRDKDLKVSVARIKQKMGIEDIERVHVFEPMVKAAETLREQSRKYFYNKKRFEERINGSEEFICMIEKFEKDNCFYPPQMASDGRNIVDYLREKNEEVREEKLRVNPNGEERACHGRYTLDSDGIYIDEDGVRRDEHGYLVDIFNTDPNKKGLLRDLEDTRHIIDISGEPEGVWKTKKTKNNRTDRSQIDTIQTVINKSENKEEGKTFIGFSLIENPEEVENLYEFHASDEMWMVFYEKAEAKLREVLDKFGFVIDEEYHDENTYNVFCHGEEIEKCMKEVRVLASKRHTSVIEKNKSLSCIENSGLFDLFKIVGIDCWDEVNHNKKDIEDFYSIRNVGCVVYFDTKYNGEFKLEKR